MDKTAFVILVERAAKYAASQNRKLRVCFEQSGKREDRAILSFLKELKVNGSPFSANSTYQYGGLTTDEFKALILGDARRATKQNPLIQIADLYLYPMAKNGYDPNYLPYLNLKKNNRLIDAVLPLNEIHTCGIKYSCFDGF